MIADAVLLAVAGLAFLGLSWLSERARSRLRLADSAERLARRRRS
jgi:hypothetical protein